SPDRRSARYESAPPGRFPIMGTGTAWASRAGRWPVDLTVIGVTPQAEEVYRYFLRHRGESVGSVPEALGMDPDTVEAAIETLDRRRWRDSTAATRATPPSRRTPSNRRVGQRPEELTAETPRACAAPDPTPGSLRARGEA